MKRASFIAWTVLALAQTPSPFVPLDGVVNGASYLPDCSPGGGIAPGSLFAVFGNSIGPAAPESLPSFPLKPSLGKVSIRVVLGDSAFDAWPIFVSSTQVAAALPGSVPPGDGKLTVTFDGRSSEAVPIRVRRSAAGIFTVNQAGTGRAVVQNIDPVTGGLIANGPDHALRPGQLANLWATGLGRVPGDEALGPLPGDRPELDVHVWVGDRLARVVYRGRSGCCAGLDQVIFETPHDIEGCEVPVSIEAGGVTSNFGSVAIAQRGQCAAPPAVSPLTVNKFGLIFFLDGFGSVLLPGAGDDYVRLAFFQQGKVDGDLEAPLRAFEPSAAMPVNSCTVRYGTEFPPQPSQPGQSPLSAGPELRVTGPGGIYRLLPGPNPGNYEDPNRVALAPGRYNINNGSGGSDVGPFSFDTDAITMRLLSQPDRIVRRDGLTLTWDYQGPSDQLVTIFGSTRSCGRSIFSFTCVARATDRRFVVPPRILMSLPPSSSFFGLSNGALNVSTTTPGGLRRFTAPGLDLGLFLQLSISSIRPNYE